MTRDERDKKLKATRQYANAMVREERREYREEEEKTRLRVEKAEKLRREEQAEAARVEQLRSDAHTREHLREADENSMM